MAPGQASLPQACGSVTYTIDATTIASRSGSLVVKSTYKADLVEGGYILHLTDTQASGEANCQGLPKEFVMSHFRSDLPLIVVEGRLREYSRDAKSHVEFVKVSSGK